MEPLILYGSPYCSQVYSVRRELDRNAIEYQYIDIREDVSAAERVRQINNGCASVPTLVFPDGTTLTEPSTSELQHKLRTYRMRVESSPLTRTLSILFEGPTLRLIAALFVLGGIFSDLQFFTWVGLALLAVSFVLFFLKKRA